MAKRVKNEFKRKSSGNQPENILPQNILAMGEHVEEDKNIYILQSVYKEIHRFTHNKTTNESGGMLIGTILEEFGKTNIIISGFVEAKHTEATPTTLKFTHETWDFVHKEIDRRYKGKKIVGWIHTHPDFGIFLSDYDKFIHQNFFNEDYHVAYVVDPIQKIEGFYFWINGKIEKCRGFYIYDKTGTKITVGTDNEKPLAQNESTFLNFRNILLTVLCAAVVFLIFSNVSVNQRLKELNSQQNTLTESANQSLYYMQQTILTQAEEIQTLKDALADAGILIEAESEDTQAGENTDADAETSDNSANGTSSEGTNEIQDTEHIEP